MLVLSKLNRKRNRREILAMETKRDQAFISRPNSGPVFLTNFYGYVEFKDIRDIDILASESRKYI